MRQVIKTTLTSNISLNVVKHYRGSTNYQIIVNNKFYMNDVPFLAFGTEANTKGDGFLARATDLYCSTTSLAYTWDMYNDTIIIEQMRKLTFMKATVIHIMSFILLYRIMPGFSSQQHHLFR